MVICSECKLDAQLKQITNIFLANGYPESVMLRSIRLKICKYNRIKIFSPPKCPLYFKLPRTEPHSQFFAKRISSSIMHCFSYVVACTIFSTRSVFPSVCKDILPILQQILVIYHYICQCEADYTGKTIQWLEVRIAQHVLGSICMHMSLTSGHSQPHEAAIGEHLLNMDAYKNNYSGEFRRA